MAVVKGTSAEDNIQAFSRHSVPRRPHSDNGAPFNGLDSHLLQKYQRNMGIDHITNKSAKDPEATGLVEAFMRHLKKIFPTAGVEREDPYMKHNNYLMQFRATPHANMKKCPAELLFGRRFNTKLPDLRTNPGDHRLVEAHDYSTIVPRTGADRSAPQAIPGSNLSQSQHLSDERVGMYEGEGVRRQERGQGSKDADSGGRGRKLLPASRSQAGGGPRLWHSRAAHRCSSFRTTDPPGL